MLFLNLQRMAELKKIPNLQKFLLKNGFSPNVAHRINNRSYSHIKFENLEKLCLLFDCTPNDLFEWEIVNNEPGNPALKRLTHKRIKRKDEIFTTRSIEELASLHKKK